MAALPVRGPAARQLGIALPPAPMARWRARRPLKRWRYVGVYTPDLMLCAGEARIGPLPQRWWAVATPDGRLRERTTFGRGGVESLAGRLRLRAGGVAIDLELDERDPVEVVSPVGEGDAYIWTAKQACVPMRGTVEIDGRRHAIDAPAGFVDDSAGYHARHTSWRWSAGVGRSDGGRLVGWNLVDGIHDDPLASERTVWLDGEPLAAGPATFADDLSEIASLPAQPATEPTTLLRFSEWSAREHSTNALLIRSRYRQPFGTFTGTLPKGLRLAEGYGVMEDHDVRW
jgi:Domain of unknown function (DUF2804), C-terminal